MADHHSPSRRHDAIVFHADIKTLRRIKLTFAFGTGVCIDGIDALERFNGFSGTYRFTVAAGGTDISYDG
jgi:hypothetical protein